VDVAAHTADVSKPDERQGLSRPRFSGHHDALYERHLLFDDVIDPASAGARERFEAAARSVRDVLSQRWVQTSASTIGRTAGLLGLRDPLAIAFVEREAGALALADRSKRGPGMHPRNQVRS